MTLGRVSAMISDIKELLLRQGLAPDLQVHRDKPLHQSLRCMMGLDMKDRAIELVINQYEGALQRSMLVSGRESPSATLPPNDSSNAKGSIWRGRNQGQLDRINRAGEASTRQRYPQTQDTALHIWYWQLEFVYPFLINEHKLAQAALAVSQVNEGLALQGFYIELNYRRVCYQSSHVTSFPQIDPLLAEHLIGLALSCYDGYCEVFEQFS